MSKCADLRKQFSAYLDGAVTGAAMQEIATHLEVCSGCAAEFAQWRTAQSLISSIGPAKAPEDLGLRLRVALSQESANTAQEKFARGRVRWQNTFRPLIWQVTAGFASTVALLGGVALLTGMFAFPSPRWRATNPSATLPAPAFFTPRSSPPEALPTATIRSLSWLASMEKAGFTTIRSSPETWTARPAPSWKIAWFSVFLPRRRSLGSPCGGPYSSPSQGFPFPADLDSTRRKRISHRASLCHTQMAPSDQIADPILATPDPFANLDSCRVEVTRSWRP